MIQPDVHVACRSCGTVHIIRSEGPHSRGFCSISCEVDAMPPIEPVILPDPQPPLDPPDPE